MKFRTTFHRWLGVSATPFLFLAAFILAPLAEPALGGSTPPLVAGFERLAATPKPDQVEMGELLLSELRCVNCHRPDAGSDRFMVHPGPRLETLSGRIRFDHLPTWLFNPPLAKPGTTMPHLLNGKSAAEQKEIARALAQFLCSTGSKSEANDKPSGSAENGRILFHSIGCVACHAPAADFKPGHTSEESTPTPISIPSVPLGNLREKYHFTGLASFLFNPLLSRPSAHMPRTPITESESHDLARYLLGESSAPPAPPLLDPAKIRRGKEYYQQLNCGACHSSPGDGNNLSPVVEAQPLSQLNGAGNQGCLADRPPGHTPDYNLSSQQRQSLRAALANLSRAKPLPASERARRMTVSLNCLACHERDGTGGPEPGRAFYFQTSGVDLEDEGRFPPRLTGVGRKLTAEALTNVLSGTGSARPYMVTRMPDFGPHAPALARCFTEADLTKNIRSTPRDGKEDQVGRSGWGRELVGVTGLSCISCHNLNGRKSLGISAVDLALAPKRLQPEWFRDYLIDPAHFRPGTRMPSFWPDGKAVSPLVSSNTARQIDSIWVYLNEIDQNRLPEGMEDKGQFELKPEKSPIVFRTFLKDAGWHAIAVGFPQKINLAFDAEQSRWALAWRGAFLNAEGTWDDRFAPLATPLGTNLIRFPPHLGLTRDRTGSPALPRFDGYRLNRDGIPTFLYRVGAVRAEDTCAPDDDGQSLRHALHLRNGKGTWWFRAAEAKSIAGNQNAWQCDNYKLILLAPASTRPEIASNSESQELWIPVHFASDGTATLQMRITW